MTESKRLYVGVGIRTYSDASFAELPKAVKDIENLGTFLGQDRGYRVETIHDPTEEEARAALKRHLTNGALPSGSALVLLWAGHGEMASEALHLIARDTKKGAAPDLTMANPLASIVARCGATQVLLLLDTCHSGAGIFEAQRVVDLVRRERADERPWFGVLASASDFERAQDGVFVARLLRLLQDGPSDPALRTRWSAHNEGVRGDDVMDAMIKEWDIDDQRPEHGQIGDPWPMFPNPKFDPDAPERVVEHLLLAAEGRAPDEEGVYFTGRAPQLEALVQWIHTDEPGVFVITGPAGSGKSAIAGRIVSLANPVQRARLLATGPLGPADPGEGAVDAHVHARRLTVDQVAEAIDRQLVRHGVLPSLPGGGARNRGELLGGLERIVRRPLIVLDGLDEAGEEVWAIAGGVVGLLVGSARVLIATRPLPSRAQGEPDLLQALAPQQIIDLGDPALSDSTHHDIVAYVRKRLAGCDPERMDRTKVAEAILQLSDQAEEGAFLLAQVVTSQLRTAPIDTSVPGWEGELSRSIEEAFARDLARVDDPDGVRELLTALAWAYGSGLPDDLWPLVATALSPTGRNFARDDVYSVLGSAGRYIVEDGDDMRAVYRLSHQRLASQLHPPAKAVELNAYHAQAASVARTLVARYRDLLTAGLRPKDRPYLSRYTWRHCADGGPEGIAALRELVEVDPDAFLLDLAAALNNLGDRYSAVGRRQEALAPTEEAVEIYRTLAHDNSASVPLTALAAALNNLGICYSDLGLDHDAIAPAEAAIEILRALAQDSPNFLRNLATAQNNLGNRYAAVGRIKDGLNITEKAVETARTVVQDNPASLPTLALGLNNLGNRYAAVGRHDDAIAATEEAVEIYRTLAQDNPNFLPDHAGALVNLGNRYNGVGRHHDALASTKKAVETYRVSAQENPAFLPDLATALNNLGICYSAVGQWRDALRPTEEAVKTYRALAQDNPSFLPDLAMALNSLGNRYSNVGRHDDALGPAAEAVKAYRALSKKNPAFLPGLAKALGSLGSHYTDVGRHHDALGPSVEALETFRVLAQTNPSSLADMAMALTNLGVSYSKAGRYDDALGPAVEAVETFRVLAQDNPASLADMAMALNSLGNRYSEVGRYDDAIAPTEEALAIFRALAQDNPAFLPKLAKALINLGNHYRTVGREVEIDAVWKQALAVLSTEDREILRSLRDRHR